VSAPQNILERLRFSRKQIDELVEAVRCHMQFKDALDLPRRLAACSPATTLAGAGPAERGTWFERFRSCWQPGSHVDKFFAQLAQCGAGGLDY